MAYAINDNCINCGVCVGECPVSCITSGDSKHVIDEGVCISCDACKAVCPADAVDEG